MSIRVDTPSLFSVLRADDKPVYLNSEGAIKTGKSLKGRLVAIAESLGIFKGYVASYRAREATSNRDAYVATWDFVTNKYGMTVRHHTHEAMKKKGYSRVDRYTERLQGCDANDPQRAIVGRELRLILDTSLGVNEALWGGVDAAQEQYTGPQYTGLTAWSDAEIATQKQRWAVWTEPSQRDAKVATPSGTETMETVAPASGDNASDIHALARAVSNKVAGGDALEADNPVLVDVLELSKNKIKAVAQDREYLQNLMVKRFGVQDQEISASHMQYAEKRALKKAKSLVQKTKAELSSAEVDDVLARALRSSLRGRTQLHETQQQPEQLGQTASPQVAESVTSPPQHPDSPESVAVATPAISRRVAWPKPKSYKGVDYFNQSDKRIRRLGIPIRNHQAARQVVADDTHLAASVPEGRRGSELTSAHRAYIKATLLRHVAEHERTKPGTLLVAADLHIMMRPITARALEMQSGRKLRAKVLYKNVTKHLGRKDAVFGDALKKLRRDARTEAWSKAGLLSFVQDAARKADIDIKIDHHVFKAIRPQVKDMAEAHVDETRTALTKQDLEVIVQIVLRGYSIANRMGRVS